MPTEMFSFAIEEITKPGSPCSAGMNTWLEQIFPEYCPPRFDRLLTKLRRPDGRHQVQIFVGLVEGQVAGLVQTFYQEWQGGLLADVDLLGVLAPYRRLGLALALFQRALQAAPAMAQQYRLPAIGVATLIEPQDPHIVRLHQKQGGQIRTDYTYPSGDVIVWYPLQPIYKDIPTPVLVEEMQRFGRLLEV